MSTTTILGAVAGFVFGWLIAWLISRARISQLLVRLEERDRQLSRLGATERELGSAREELAGTRKQLEAERKSADEKLAVLRNAEQSLKEAFDALSGEALRQNTDSFLTLAASKLGDFQQASKIDLDARQKAIADLVKPIEEGIKKVDATITEVENLRNTAYIEIRNQVQSMAATQVQLKGETANLVKALRAPHVRGRWGEMQLRRVVEMAGMLEYCDFMEQQSLETDDGRLRPDMIIRLPGGKQIIVDAKAPLSAYLESIEASDEGAREAFLQAHSRQVRDHMTKLGDKRYQDVLGATPEFVFMFLPGETFYSAALQQDPSLLEYGVQSRVIPASPITLIALLKAVSYGWSQEKLAKNAQAIRDLGRTLYDRIRGMAEHLEAAGSHLEKTVGAYNKAIGSLEGRVLVSARRFRDLDGGSLEEIGTLESVDAMPRQIQAGELRPEALETPAPGQGEDRMDQ